MNLSMETAFYINSICNLLALLLMILYLIKHNNFRNCAPCFIFYYVLSIIASLMIASRNELGTFLSVVVANLFTVVALLFMK